MALVSSFFWQRDFWVLLKDYSISNLIFYALTYILPQVPKGVASDIYTLIVQYNKSSYYSKFFVHVFSEASHFDSKKIIYKWIGYILIGNNARSSLILLDLVKGRFKLFNHLYFYIFKLIKSLVLGIIYLQFKFYGKEIVSGIDWMYTMRVNF